MFTRIIRFCLAHKILTLLGTFAMAAWGIYSFSRLPVDAIPDITNNQVQILTLCPTLSTQEVERFVTLPIEQQVRNSPGIRELRSISRFGLSVITVVFEEDLPIYQARQIVQERLLQASDEIPASFGRPELAPVSTGLGEILHYRIETLPGYEDRYSAADLRIIQDWIIKRQLAGIEGVVEINSMGGDLRQFEIAVDPARLRALDLSLTELYDAVTQANQNTGAAYMERQADIYFIRAEGLARDTEDISRIVVARRNGVPVLVRDVAEVRMGQAIRYGAVTSAGKGEIVLGIIMMLKDANAAHVIRRVKERMAVIQSSLPEGVVMTPFLDRENLVKKTILTVRNNLLEGAFIVIVVLFLLVGDWRAALVISSVIPLSFLFAIALMAQTGITANLMSLGSLDFGLVIDGAIILVEASLFYLLLRRNMGDQDRRLSRQEMDAAIIEAADKVARSSAFGVLIIIIVYLPVMALTGIEGKMFRPMALTVSFALLGALLLSLTFIPVAASLFLSRKPQRESRISAGIMGALAAAYRPALEFALRRPVLTVGLTLLIFSGAVTLFSRMGGEFIPELDEGDILLHGFCKPGTSLGQTMESHRLLQDLLLREFPDEIDQVISKIGTAEIPTDPMAIESADNIVLLHPPEQWTRASGKDELIALMEPVVAMVPGMAFEFTQPIKMRFDEMMTGVRSDIALKIFGENLDTLAHYAEQVSGIIRETEGIRDVKVEQVLGLPQLQINYRYDRLARYGVTVEEANASLRTAFAGATAGHIYENERRFDLVVRLPEELRRDPEQIGRLPVRAAEGGLIPLNAVAETGFINGAAQISRENGQRRIVIGANVRGRDVETAIEELERRIERELKLPAGYYIAYGGQFENLREAKERLKVAVPVALFLIAILLYITFGRVMETVLIMTAIPLAAIGGVLALWLRDLPFSISAGVGFIALSGIAVLNGIVLITYLNELELEGMTDLRQRLRQATSLRLRPVMMTAATDALGFLPMALAHSAGAEVQRPLATVVIGGLVTATLLTLVVLPALYLLFKSWQRSHVSKALAVLPFLILTGGGAMAQNTPLDEATALRLLAERHPAIRAGQAATAAELARKDAPVLWDPARIYQGMNADPGEGLWGSAFLGAEVFFPNRSRTRSARSLYQHRAETAALTTERTLAEQEKEVKILYVLLGHNRAMYAIHSGRDSLYRDLVRIARVRYENGESGPVEPALIADKARQVGLEKHQTEHEFLHLCQELALLIGQTEPVNPLLEPFAEEPDPFYEPTPAAGGGLLLKVADSRIREAQSQRDLARAQLKPELGTDLMAQYLPDRRVYPGYNLTLRLPLFRKGYQAAIQSAQVGILQAEAEREHQSLERQRKLTALDHQMEILQHRIRYYMEQGLPAADELLRVSSAG
jgi:heavy metal efflux system protein